MILDVNNDDDDDDDERRGREQRTWIFLGAPRLKVFERLDMAVPGSRSARIQTRSMPLMESSSLSTDSHSIKLLLEDRAEVELHRVAATLHTVVEPGQVSTPSTP